MLIWCQIGNQIDANVMLIWCQIGNQSAVKCDANMVSNMLSILDISVFYNKYFWKKIQNDTYDTSNVLLTINLIDKYKTYVMYSVLYNI